MFQTDQATAVSVLPTPLAAGTPGYFTNGNPATGVAATILDADFMNMLMMELANLVTGAGLTLSKTTYNQVLSAIRRIGQNTLVLADTGAVNAYTAVNATPLVAGTWVDGVVQAVKVAHTNTGASTYAPDGLPAIPIYGLGLQPLQGSELLLNGTAILMRATIAGLNSGNPICVLMECAGGPQQVAPATHTGQALTLGQFQSGSVLYGIDSGTVNVVQATFPVPPTTLTDNQQFWVNIANANTGSVTFTPNPGVIAASTVIGANGTVLQGGELAAGGRALLVWNQSITSYMLDGCTFGALQTSSATKSQQAVTYGQTFGLGQTLQNVTGSRVLGTTYTNSTGKPITVYVSVTSTAAVGTLVANVNGSGVVGGSWWTAGSPSANVSVIIPSGSTYSFTLAAGTGTVITWYECR